MEDAGIFLGDLFLAVAFDREGEGGEGKVRAFGPTRHRHRRSVKFLDETQVFVSDAGGLFR